MSKQLISSSMELIKIQYREKESITIAQDEEGIEKMS
jgi:hypothetical protein